MRVICLTAILFITCFSSQLFARTLLTYQLPLEQNPSFIYQNSVRVGIMRPDLAPIGDIFYLIGFGDRLDNHIPLFETWANAGFRVISFDYPSMGETTGTSLNLFSIKRIAKMATQVEADTREDSKRPLLVAGWSTGGLITVRMAQSDRIPHFGREVKGMILFAPGVSVRWVVGTPTWSHWFGEISNSTLTHDPNPPHVAPAMPVAPITDGSFLFSLNLKFESIFSQWEAFPPTPTMIFVGGEEGDRYANSADVEAWIDWENNKNGARIVEIKYPGAMHEIDNETKEYGGPESRDASATFAKMLGAPNPVPLQAK